MNKIKLVLIVAFFGIIPFWGIRESARVAVASQGISVWWPEDGAKMNGVQPFKALYNGKELSDYQMFWYVDNGTWNWMNNNYDTYPHKEASVDLTNWYWHDNGPYEVVFVARDNQGNVLTKRTVEIYIDRASTQTDTTQVNSLKPIDSSALTISLASAPAPAPSPTQSPSVVPCFTQAPSPTPESVQIQTFSPDPSPTPTSTPNPTQTPYSPIPSLNPTTPTPSPTPATQTYQTQSSSNPFIGAQLFVNPNSQAKLLADAWRSSRPTDASLLDKIAKQPEAQWFGDWNGDIYNDVNTATTYITQQGDMPVFIAYNIPQRDCGGYSAGGSNSPDGYKTWISNFAKGIGNRKAAVILEPDALPGMDCLSSADQQTRLDLIKYAVQTLNAQGNVSVYLDAGNLTWHPASVMADRLKKAGVDMARGFSLNVSGYETTADTTGYGQQIASMINKPFVIDTSRNGLGSNGEWCNPPGRALGLPPTANTGNSMADAYLWLKVPGESDGTCNGGPSAGTFWPDYALGLASRASW